MSLLEHCLIPDWPAPPAVHALQTTRRGGLSASPFDSLNLGCHVGDDVLVVNRNRMLLAPLMPSEPVWLNQVHGIEVVNAGVAGCLPQGDASMTTRRNAVCVVMTADCLPILLCDAAGSVVAAVHAGWRGLCEGVIEAAVHRMQVPPATLMAWLGPAIGPSAFEVGGEVREAFVRHDTRAAAAFVAGMPGKWLADIFELARQRLHAAGIHHIYGGGVCTYSDPARYYSYRRDGSTGRMGTFIWLSAS